MCRKATHPFDLTHQPSPQSFELLGCTVTNYFQPHLDPRHFICNQEWLLLLHISRHIDSHIFYITFIYDSTLPQHVPHVLIRTSWPQIFLAIRWWETRQLNQLLGGFILGSQPIGFTVARQQGMHPSSLSFDGHATQGQIGLELPTSAGDSNQERILVE